MFIFIFIFSIYIYIYIYIYNYIYLFSDYLCITIYICLYLFFFFALNPKPGSPGLLRCLVADGLEGFAIQLPKDTLPGHSARFFASWV